MRRSTFNYIEDMLRDYPHYNEYIKECEEEIRHPYVEPDANIGGGRSAGKQERLTETIVRIDEDRRIRQMKRQQKAIAKCLDRSNSDIVYQMCKELYFMNKRRLTLDGVAYKLNVSRRTLIRRREDFFIDLAKELGMQ
ncbi:transcriptional regulator [Latilactobacillus fragifolii]|uniref:transcriptional regulator n=1 Tax=Latilactobacillus fragifolii TaxID=2814244 RepID=UPI001ABB424F|nr:transcriptional regulator [Latilactobacillus fragifolii]